jgi:hypothetical protein
VRLLGDLPHRRLAGVPAGSDHLADECLPRDDADEAVPVADEDRPHLGPSQRLAGVLSAVAHLERGRVGDHCFADKRHG